MELSNYIHILQLHNLFKDFSKEELIDIFNKNSHRICEYNKNSIIHVESEECSTLDVVLQGQIIVQRIDENGNVLTIAEFHVGESIGSNLLFGNNNTYPMSILAKLDTVILHIQKDFLLDLCQDNKRFLIEFLKCVSDKTFILTNKIKSISMKSLRESIIDFLNCEYHTQKSNTIQLNMTKKELAEILGVQRTSLSRELNKMRKDNLINYDSHSITIKDLNVLKKAMDNL
ncbi:Crp/Fnr family transcriptional regulator [Anaeromicrobium sediminis]|uniref:Transcriptional regulator n=1 Tax=Anaeromicrobium sediminis TaxID=1478221 RepID=A0A267MHV0_9FIRM|nr:Crp/Fnr family transcriptional regulator [Anaeromicrobium sediminis]PAB58380.1 transcriptional regulator [Anaeromicrobium sediminis]